MQNIIKFQEKELELIDINGKAYMRSSDLARALDYSSSDKVGNLYRRNADEFTDDMTLTPRLSVKGYGNGNSERTVRVFSLRGCHLIAMLANTPVAKAFRKWCLDILEGKIPLPVPPKKDGRGAPLGNQNARKKPLALPAPESPIKIAAAYEQPAFEGMLRRIVREELAGLFAPAVKETSEQAKAHPSGMPFGNWAASIVHAVGGMRSEYEALQKAKSTGSDDRIKAIRQIVGA